MSKELKIGIVSIITMIIVIWGYQYLKGKNILKTVYDFHVVYPNVEGIKEASPVEINGYQVGSISNITLNPDDVNSMVVKFDVEGDYKLPKNTIAVLSAANSLVGTKKIILSFDRQCNGDDCAKSGDYFEAGTRGVLESIVGTSEIKEYFAQVRDEVGPVMDSVLASVSDENADNAISRTLLNLDQSMGNLASLTRNMDALLKTSYSNLNDAIANLAVVSGSLAKTNGDIEKIVTNFSELSTQLVDADLGGALSKTGETFDNTNELITELKATVENAKTSFDSVNDLLNKAETGKGSIAQLLNNPELYDNLESSTRHLALLLQDMRLNPKRYVRLSVFGRKGNAYTFPEDDPAYQNYLDSLRNN